VGRERSSPSPFSGPLWRVVFAYVWNPICIFRLPNTSGAVKMTAATCSFATLLANFQPTHPGQGVRSSTSPTPIATSKIHWIARNPAIDYQFSSSLLLLRVCFLGKDLGQDIFERNLRVFGFLGDDLGVPDDNLSGLCCFCFLFSFSFFIFLDR
jgi:hypothetical protein